MNSAIETGQETGTLKIKVPHWLVQVRIYDMLGKLITTENEFDDPQEGEYLVKNIELNLGIYELEYAFADKVEKRMIIIKPGKNSDWLDKSSGSWKKLQIGSSIPFENSTESEKIYSAFVETWSAVKTKKEVSNNEACLFLSIKAPKGYENVFEAKSPNDLSDIFDLKDSLGNSVINFQDDIQRAAQEACLVFNADLPPGPYTLEWINYLGSETTVKKMKNSKCYQPLYLHRNWTTQVFLLTHTPLSNAFSLNIARYGTSFSSADQSVIAAEALLETLSQQVSESILHKQRMKEFVGLKKDNPWVGVLMAYAMISQDSLDIDETKIQDIDLFRNTMNFLQTELPDHPDVLALQLKTGEDAKMPFHHPPLLKAALRRVQMHALQHESTVPHGGLIDQIINTPLISGPWVSWEKLYTAFEEMPASDAADVTEKEWAPTVIKQGAFSADSISAKLPVFKFYPPDNTYEGKSFPAAANNTSSLQQVSLLNLTEHLSVTGRYQDLPDQIDINPGYSVINYISQLDAKEISHATKMPLSGVTNAIRSIINKGEELLSETSALSRDQQQVISYAFKKKSKHINDIPAAYVAEEQATEAAGEEQWKEKNKLADKEAEETETEGVTIEQCVSRIRAEVKRLFKNVDGQSATPTDPEENPFANRLIKITESLLRRADFTVKTGVDEKIYCANGAFMYLISSPTNYISVDSFDIKKLESEYQRMRKEFWERTIAAAPKGTSDITAPVPGYFEKWTLKKVDLVDEQQHHFYGRLNILRGYDAPTCKQEMLNAIGEQLSGLALYAPLYEMHSSRETNRYSDHLDKIISKMQMTMKEFDS